MLLQHIKYILLFCILSSCIAKNKKDQSQDSYSKEPTEDIFKTSSARKCINNFDRPYLNLEEYSLLVGKGAIFCGVDEIELIEFVKESKNINF